jgi:hypothetical protein
LTLSGLSGSGVQTGGRTPALQYEQPSGFSRGAGDPQTWIADGLDSVIHLYPFRPFHGEFAREFRRTLFRDWIAAPYQEDRRLDEPMLTSLTVRGAREAMAASFKNFNGGAPRQHLRVAVLASGRVALVDISTNSPDAFERNRASFSRLLDSLQVVEREPSAAGVPPH